MLLQILSIFVIVCVDVAFSKFLWQLFDQAPLAFLFWTGTGLFFLKCLVSLFNAASYATQNQLTRWKFEPFHGVFFSGSECTHPNGSSINYFQASVHVLNILYPLLLIWHVREHSDPRTSFPLLHFLVLASLWLVLWVVANVYFSWQLTSVMCLKELVAIVRATTPPLPSATDKASALKSPHWNSPDDSSDEKGKDSASRNNDATENSSALTEKDKDPFSSDESFEKYISIPTVAYATCMMHIRRHLVTAIATAILLAPLLWLVEYSAFFACVMLQFLVDGMMQALLDYCLKFEIRLDRYPFTLQRKLVAGFLFTHPN